MRLSCNAYFILTNVNSFRFDIFVVLLATFIAKTPQMLDSSCEELWELAKSALGFCK